MINNPSQEISFENTRIFRAIWAALQTQTSNSAKNFITKMAKEETAEALAAGANIEEFSVGVRLRVLRMLSSVICSRCSLPGAVVSFHNQDL
jgi:hypothetical protein